VKGGDADRDSGHRKPHQWSYVNIVHYITLIAAVCSLPLRKDRGMERGSKTAISFIIRQVDSIVVQSPTTGN
jgi:hypothetical protein